MRLRKILQAAGLFVVLVGGFSLSLVPSHHRTVWYVFTGSVCTAVLYIGLLRTFICPGGKRNSPPRR